MSPTECARRATPPGLRSSRRTQRRRGDMSRYQQMRRPAFLEPNRCHTALLLERCPDRNLTLLDARDLIDIRDAGPNPMSWIAERLGVAPPRLPAARTTSAPKAWYAESPTRERGPSSHSTCPINRVEPVCRHPSEPFRGCPADTERADIGGDGVAESEVAGIAAPVRSADRDGDVHVVAERFARQRLGLADR